MKIYNIKQQTPEWFEIKKLHMSASHAQAVGNNGKGLQTYAYKVLSEYLATNRENYSNDDMDRGNELEPEARAIYELETGNKVDEVGFIELDDRVGCSPDGLVDEDGGIEIKCPNNQRFTEIIINKEKAIDSNYIWQIQMNLLITGRKWWDFVAYNPNFKNPIIIIRIFPDEEKFKELEEGFNKGREIIQDLMNKLK